MADSLAMDDRIEGRSLQKTRFIVILSHGISYRLIGDSEFISRRQIFMERRQLRLQRPESPRSKHSNSSCYNKNEISKNKLDLINVLIDLSLQVSKI